MSTSIAKRPTMSELIWHALYPAPDSGPVFWIDPRGEFAAALPALELPAQIETLTAEASLRLRVAEDGNDAPLKGRLFYLRDRDALEPLAEIAHCFGRICTVEFLDVLRQAGLEITAATVAFVKEHATALIVKWDDIPANALKANRLADGLAAAVCGVSTLDPVDLAVAQLRNRYVVRSLQLSKAAAADGKIAAQSASAVSANLARAFALPGSSPVEHELLRFSILADLMRSPRGESLVSHLLPAEARQAASRLAERIAADAKLLKAVQGELGSITDHLGIDIEGLDDATLLNLLLVPQANEIAVQRLQNALTSVEPANAWALLDSISDIVLSEEAFEPYRTALECYHEMASTSAELKRRNEPPEWYLERYAERWYRTDEFYRRAMVGVSGGLKDALQTRYRTWLRDVNVAFSEALDARESWVFPNSQRAIGKTFAQIEGRFAVVIMDALRLEMARDLVSRLPRTVQCDLGTVVASLPSITEVGMSALTPSSDAMRLEVSDKKLKVFVGGRETTQKSARDELWRTAGFKVLGPEDVPLLAPSDDRVVVFHGAVDAIGEKLQAQFFDHAERLVTQLAQMFKDLLQKGYEIVATADHGFLTLPPADDSGQLRAGTTEDEVKKRRYRVSASEPLEEPVINRTASQLGFEGAVTVGFPPAASVLRAHGASTFLHGGISLQELVIPHFRVRVKPKAVGEWSVTFPKKLNARAVRVAIVTTSDTNAGKTICLGVWVGGRKICETNAIVEQVGRSLTLTAYLPDETPSGEVSVKVSVAGGAAIEEKSIMYDPQRI